MNKAASLAPPAPASVGLSETEAQRLERHHRKGIVVVGHVHLVYHRFAARRARGQPPSASAAIQARTAARPDASTCSVASGGIWSTLPRALMRTTSAEWSGSPGATRNGTSGRNHERVATPTAVRYAPVSSTVVAASASDRSRSVSGRDAGRAVAVRAVRVEVAEGGASVVWGLERRGWQRVAEPIGERGAHGVTSLDRRQPERAAGRAEVA